MSNTNATVLIRVWAGLLLIFTPALAAAQTVGCEQVLTLADLERMALQANPTSAQAQAAIRAAEGRRVQAGLWPNPVVGYTGEEFSTRAFSEKSEHFAFIEQTILLGGKLGKSRRIFAQEKVLAEQEAIAQRYRILNTVRMLFYEALGAQRRVETRAELVRIAREAVGVTEQLFNVGQADRPDAYQIEIEAQRAQLDLVMAENRQDQVWQQLGAVLGDPFLKPACLVGDLERGLPALDLDAALATLLGGSPELKRAQAAVQRARAAIARAKAERVPDLFLRGGFGYSTELLETRNPRLAGRKTGPEGFLEKRGLTLSGGQRQRIAIARAIIRNSPILILDEPSSGLDAASEDLVFEALNRLTRNKTTIVIAHRLTTVRKADLIFVLQDGGVVESGAHKELLARGGLYAQLHEIQFGAKALAEARSS